MKSKKLLFAFLLALIVCLLLVPSAFAEGAEWSVQYTDENGNNIDNENNGQKEVVGNLQELIGEEPTEPETPDTDSDESEEPVYSEYKTISLTPVADDNTPVTVNESFTVYGGQSVVIDLGGNTYSTNGTLVTVDKGGSLTLTNGTIYAQYYDYDVDFTCNGSLIFDNVTLSGIDGGNWEGLSLVIKGNGQVTFNKDVSLANKTGNSIMVDDSLTVNVDNCSFSDAEITIGAMGSATLNIDLSESTDPQVCIEGYGSSTVNINGGKILGVAAFQSSVLNIYGGEFFNDLTDDYFPKSVFANNNSTIYGGTFAANYIYNSDDSEAVPISDYLAPGYRLVEKDGKFVVEAIPAVVAPVVETVAEYVPAVVETVNNIIAISGNDNNSYSIFSNEDFTITLSFSDPSANDQLPEILSVSVNGVEVDFRIAQDGTIILSPEVLAALGPGTHVITIMTSNGPVTMTIVITD